VSAPTWGDLLAFCKADRWDPSRQTKHDVYRKVLADGTALQTQTSRGKESDNIGAGLFHFILRVELQVSEAEFWEAIRTAEPASRPAHPAPPHVSPKPSAGLIFLLRKHVRVGDDEIGKLSKDEAVEMLNEYFSRPASDPSSD
jgi:hypothetical protein